jgi:tetratricopeptide (TPR) repeat protein
MTLPTPADNAWRPSPVLGREALLRALGTRLPAEMRLVIGVDPALQCRQGIGRTRLVAELVRRIDSQYTHVIQLCGASPATWNSSLLQATRQLSLRQTSFRRASDLTGAVRGWLSSHENWLLVVDPITDLDDLKELLEGIVSGHVIAVLSDSAPATHADWPAAVPLGSLSTDDALQVLRGAIDRDWSNTEEILAATHIVNELERNPLCAELAGRAMRLSRMAPAEFLPLLHSMPSRTPLLSVLTILLATIEDQQPLALTLLAAGVALGPAPIPPSLLKGMADRLSDANALLNLLRKCGLVRGHDDGRFDVIPCASEIHSLLSPATLPLGLSLTRSTLPTRVVRNRLHEYVCGDPDLAPDPLAVQRIWLGQTAAAATTLDPDQVSAIHQAADAALDLLLPSVAQKLLTRALDHAIQTSARDELLLEPLVSIGTAYVLGEQFQLARRRWRQAMELCPVEHPLQTELLLAIAEIDVNENRLDRAAGRLQLAIVNCQSHPMTPHHQLLTGQLRYLQAGVALGQNQPETARDLFRAAHDLRASLLPVDDALLMRNRLLLARTEFLRKDYAACERLLLDEVAIREKSPRVSETELGIAYNFLSEQYYLSGRLSDAEPVYERTLELRRATFPRGHRLIGEMVNRLAVIKSARGAYKEADALFREALSILEQTYGADHPEVARVLNDLSESLFAQNKVEPARRLLERALHIQERALRANDARLGRTRCNLAAVYVARGRFAEAVRLYERDIADRQSHPKTDQASLATALNNLAEALRSLGRHSEAEQRLQQSLAIREAMVGPDHPQVAQILNNLGYLHLQQHQYDKSRTCLQRALKIRETCLSPVHPHVATTLGTLAEVEFTEGHYTVARPLYARAIDIYVAAHGERHPHAASLQICSARNELRMGHVGRAELMLLRGQGTISEVLGADHRMNAKVLLGLAELAHAEERYESAFPLLERSLAIQLGTMSSQRLEIAETLRLIALNLVARHLIAEALPRIVEALDIQQATLGASHIERAPNLLLLGRILQQLGDAPQAEAALRSVIEQADAVTQSCLIDEAREALPDVLIQSQQYDEAAELLAARVSRLEAQGPSPQLLNTVSQLAGVHYLRHAPDAAAPLMERCVALSEQLHGADSAETAKHLDNLAGVRFLLGQYEQAEPAIRRAIGILEQERPVRTAPLMKARENYVQLLRQTNRALEADQLAALVSSSPPAPEPQIPSGHVLDDL